MRQRGQYRTISRSPRSTPKTFGSIPLQTYLNISKSHPHKTGSSTRNKATQPKHLQVRAEQPQAKEIGRKAIQLNGNISANNFVQLPHPSAGIKTLGLTGRYFYLQVKAPISSSPFSFHLDLQLADRSHGIRISASNLYKQMSTQNGFSLQVPLNLDVNRWTVVVLDIYELLKISGLLQVNYQISGCYQIKQIMLCACSIVRGVFTSENLYDFVTLPPEMRFKFAFHISKWPEQFAWLELPSDLKLDANEAELALQRMEQTRAKAALIGQVNNTALSNRQKDKMEAEIAEMLDAKRQQYLNPKKVETKPKDLSRKLQELQDSLNLDRYGSNDMLSPDDQLGFTNNDATNTQESHRQPKSMAQLTGQYVGDQGNRSAKLNLDPILELKHIIGFSPDKCQNLKWSRVSGEHVVLYTSGGVLIAMDVEKKEQKRFFFGHSAPICCFDVANHGGLVASAQEVTKTEATKLAKQRRIGEEEESNGKPHIVRIWDYHTARCISHITMPPVTQIKCLAFSADGRYLACSGKDGHNREMIVIWDISQIHRGGKPEIAAKQTTEFNILDIKFSPIDNCRLVSCGKENIRFWRVKETGNIRGAAVVLNHHARDTVFTALDFEWGAVAAANNQALQKVYVASKHGMVFQINYETEAVEATFRNNDTAIYSIAINESLCVTGSAGKVTIWYIDQSFNLEALMSGQVCQVQISPDGLNVVCGTVNGCIAIINMTNKENQKGHGDTLMHSHSDSILSMDYHVPQNVIITCSQDGTIKLWSMHDLQNPILFISKIDQPLCVAAHPTAAIFSCGFQSGTMRVFNMEQKCQLDEFTQFNKPVKKLCYSPNGDILVTCSEDGSVAIHNATRQHLPTKMMHLEFPPKFVHIAFSPASNRGTHHLFKQEETTLHEDISEANEDDESNENQNYYNIPQDESTQFEGTIVQEVLFGIMGEYGNNMMIYDSESVILKHQIQAKHVLMSFEFTKDGREVVLVTQNLKLQFFKLSRFEGEYLRQIETVHRSAINSIDLSMNGGFMLTGGEDNLIKVWDYDAVEKPISHYFQAFIGHTYPITDVMFNPNDNKQIISTAGADGIYIWQFAGDTETSFFPEPKIDQTQVQLINEKNMMHQPTVLERMRMSVKEKKKPRLAEFSFIVPPFEFIQQLETNLIPSFARHLDEQTELQIVYEDRVRHNQVNYNHFVSVQPDDESSFDEDQVGKRFNVNVDKKNLIQDITEGKSIEPTIINGYDGFSGAHDNLLWNSNQGTIIYTLNNKLIKEDTKTRKQTVFAESRVRLACLAQTVDFKTCAVGEGEKNPDGKSLIYLFDMEHNKLISTLVFHEHGVQCLKFAQVNNMHYLISVATKRENSLVVWDYNQGLPMNSILLPSHSTNQIVINLSQPNDDSETFEFFAVGSKGFFAFFLFDGESSELKSAEGNLSKYPQLYASDFVCAAYTQVLSEGIPIILLGCSDGSLLAYDRAKNDFLNFGQKVFLLEGQQIGNILCKNNTIVLSSSQGMIVKYQVVNNRVLPPEADATQIVTMKAESAVMSLVMDELNVEGILGTSLGNIFYLNLEANQLIRLVSRASNGLDSVNLVRFDTTNQAVFLSSTGEQSGEVKLFTTGTLDQVVSFPFNQSPVKFICGYQSNKQKKFRLIGHAAGEICLLDLNTLKYESVYKMELRKGEELTTGAINQNGMNFAIGTNFGDVYLGQFKKENHTGFEMKSSSRSQQQVVKLARLVGLTKADCEEGVTSIQLSTFNPDGCLLVSFDSAQVRVWQSTSQQDQDKPKSKSNQKKVYDIGDLGVVQFNVIDKFDMFQNPHQLDSISDEDQDKIDEIFRDKKYPRCEAIFAPDLNGVDLYFSYVSALQYIFVRNYTEKTVVKRIPLLAYPTCLQIIKYNDSLQALGLPIQKGGALQAMLAVGTEEGKVLLHKVVGGGHNMNNSVIGKTKGGIVFGKVSSVCLTDNGFTMIVSSDSGELSSYDLKEVIKESAE